MILSGGMWGMIGISESAMYEIVRQQCCDEIRRISSSVLKLRSSYLRTIFKSLKTIAVGSIYGADLQHWYSFKESRDDEDLKKAYMDGAMALADIVDFLRLQHFCSMDWMTPFGLPSMSDTQFDTPNVPKCTSAVHFNYQTVLFPMILGAPIQWVGDLNADHGKGSLERLDKQFKKIVLSREEVNRDVTFQQAPVDIEIYLPIRVTSQGDVEDWKTFDASKGKVYEEALRQASGHDDKVRFYTGVMEKPCPACGLGDEVSC
jgi:hypothetical protein